jgi:hypothetical protein
MEKQNAEHLLRLLAYAATLCSADRANPLPVLRQASALLWRLEPSGPPISALVLEQKLSAPIECWLSNEIRGDYSGPLLTANMTTQTCNEMMLELNVSQLLEVS